MMVVDEGLHWKQTCESAFLEGQQELAVGGSSFREHGEWNRVLTVLTVHVALLMLTDGLKCLRSRFLIESIDIDAVQIV